MEIKKTWCGTPPTHCEVCGRTLANSGMFIDGRTTFGYVWAIMCTACHASSGVGLGTGRGQKYTLDRKTGEWVKDAS